MAVYTTPSETHEHFIERDTGSGSGIWAVVAILIVLFALLFFGSSIFGNRGSTNNTPTQDNNGSINGSVETPNGSGSGSINY